MSKQIIIDWQRDGLIVATGTSRGTKFSIDTITRQAIGGEGNHSSASLALRKAMQEIGGGKGDATIVAARDLVEVRTVAVPRIEASELPDIIRFQAQRQLANMGETWALDFVLLPQEPGNEMQTALVGVISPAHLAEMDAACTAAGLQLTHVALRPIEIARFALGTGKLPATGSVLLLSMSEANAELMMLIDGRVIQVRGTKLPTDAAQLQAAIKGEIRRSLMAASSQLGPSALGGALIIAAPELSSQVAGVVAEAAGCPASVLDPASVLPSSLESRDELSAQVGHRLSAIAGATAFPTADKRSTLDFKNPKKRPPKKNNTRTYALAAAAAVTLLLAGVSWWMWTNQDLDSRLASLRAQVTEQEKQAVIATERAKQKAEVAAFLNASPNWLDEVAYIAKQIPPSDKVLVFGTQFSTTALGDGQITIEKVLADSDETISAFEASLRDEHHEVMHTSKTQKQTGAYAWHVKEIITVKDRGWDLIPHLQLASSAGTTPPKEAIKAADEAADEAATEAPETTSSDDELPSLAPDEAKQANSEPQGDDAA